MSSMPHLMPVTSSRIAEIGYDEDQFALYIRFPATKKAPAGKVYRYGHVSEEMFHDFQSAESLGTFFGQHLLKNPDHPCTLVDEGLESASDSSTSNDVEKQEAPVDSQPVEEPIRPAKFEVYEPSVAVPDTIPELPEDDDGLKLRALEVKEAATALRIDSPAACEEASRRVLLIRAERKIATAKPQELKDITHKAWKAACEFFNEVDSYYAEAERYYDHGILQFRRLERERAQAESARIRREEELRLAEARRKQQEEHERLQREAKEEADRRAQELAKQDAAIAEAQGMPAEMVRQIAENPLPVAVEPVAPPPLEYTPAGAMVPAQSLPQVKGLGFTTVWLYEILDESLIPFTHEFYSLDLKKVNAKVESLKKHANIPGVRVYSEERPIKRAGRK
jgi:hypothetical protein